MAYTPPSSNCPLCPRLYEFREQNRMRLPHCFNAPVPSFGGLDARLLVVGLAPGLKGANCSGRPFTGDYAGVILYNALLAHGFAQGAYEQRPDDGLVLTNCRITNAVRCVPPQNKPQPEEEKTCNRFLQNELAAMANIKVILTLGTISHKAVLRALKQKLSRYKFAHAAEHAIGNIIVLNTYHTSRYNINTGRLTPAMFDKIIARAKVLSSFPEFA